MSNDDTKVCPVCGESIKSSAIKCRFCNTDLESFQTDRAADAEKVLFAGHPVAIYSFGQWIVVALTLGLAYLYYWLESLRITYKITTQRIKVERGLLSTETDSVELFTVEHFDLHKPLGMRLLGFCQLRLSSSDASYRTVNIYGIPNLETLADTLRECSLRERTRRRVTSIIQP
ncbi:MAG TPA: hypothetical protein DIT28_16430 [Oxalobacteraceae bacterium]|jgi:uncharacterized membrane protein YdbT with pleckstrin-like domain|nr:hypothetical protein [Oxalobacteraceae bacterium]HCN90735.1 hypothetical protein [Oxalobacteraceae bacterium]